MTLNDLGIHSGEAWNYHRRVLSSFAVARSAIQRDDATMLAVARPNLFDHAVAPGNSRRRAQCRLRLRGRTDVGSDAKATADCRPQGECLTGLLIATQNKEAEDERND